MEKDSLITKENALTIAFLLLSLTLLAFSWSKLPPQIPLFYSRPWGEEQLASPLFLLILPASTLIIFLAALATKRITDEELLWQIIFGATTIFSFFSFLALFKIITLTVF